MAWTLVDRPGIDLIVLGGAIRPGMHSMLGHLTEMASRELRADTLFVGIGAISLDHGLMNDSVPEIVGPGLRRMARRCVVLADARKFDLVAPAYVFGLDEVDTIVTNDAANRDDRGAARARGRGHRRRVGGDVVSGRMAAEIRQSRKRSGRRSRRRVTTPPMSRAHSPMAVSGASTSSAHRTTRRSPRPRPPPPRARTRPGGPGHDRRRVPPLRAGAGAGRCGRRHQASGEFRDVLAVTEPLRGRVPTVAIVHNPGSR